ncbi:hypothetical protein E4K72_15485 [Oxalobacteraceae bacterium OM1]|nr:hypothetical protein E4K72_15485 [Oxalobacteraceae bacterium OM1]
MEGIKAIIRGNGVESSVEFSVEEVMARHEGTPWSELSEAERDAALKEYARGLFERQNGTTGDDLRVSLQGGSFSHVDERDI